MRAFWNNLKSYLEKGHKTALLYVIDSKGSSPGRQGFCMAVTDTDEMTGTIGGGIMEQKLVELAKTKLSEGWFAPFRKHQVHSAEAKKNRSGMICSGEQTVVFYYLDPDDLPVISSLTEEGEKALNLTEKSLAVSYSHLYNNHYQLSLNTNLSWSFTEQIEIRNTAFVFGGGHVGLSMCRVLNLLGFNVVLLDDRPDLNTMEQNSFADKKLVIDYDESEKYVTEGEHSYVIIMSFGYRTDEQIIRRLLGKKFRYLGMMGSKNKIETMWEKLLEDGFKKADLDAVHAPIGLPIHSKTTDEIAISIAAQIIAVKNAK